MLQRLLDSQFIASIDTICLTRVDYSWVEWLLPNKLDAELRITLILSLLLVGCSESNSKLHSPSTRIDTSTASSSPEPWGGLKVGFSGTPVSDASEALVLLHGYGASSSDLMPIADHIGGKSRVYIFPEAPVSLPSGGTAWATTEQEFAKSKLQIIALVNYVRNAHPKMQISVGGFSQGATLAASLVAETDLPVKELVLYSPALKLSDSDLPTEIRPVIFLSHGREDNVLPFSDSERLRDLLQSRGGKIHWHPFAGGHTVTLELLDATRQLLDDRE